MATIDLLFFGPNLPKMSYAASPTRGARVEVRKVYCLDLSPRRRNTKPDEMPDSLTWKYLWEHTRNPEDLPLCLNDTFFFQFEGLSEERSIAAWTGLTMELYGMCGSDAERQFFKKFVDDQRRNSSKAEHLWEKIAVIPQVWVNFRPYAVQDPTEARERLRTPFRVDFLIVEYGGDHIVVEIDGHHHYETVEATMKTLTKSRYLLREGWKHFRLHAREVQELTAGELFSEIGVFTIPF